MHDHGHGHHHGHSHGQVAGSAALLLALGLTLGFSFVEAAAGWWAGSLALLGDAGHMLTDSIALALAALAARLAKRPPSQRLTYGLGRMEALAALINGLLMLAVVAGIVWHAIERLLSPQDVAGGAVTTVALIGLGINLLAAWLLSRGGNDLNTRAALLHVMGDLLGSVAALAAGLIIQFTGWMPIDPLLSVLICGLILASTLSLLRQVFTTLLEGVPESLSLPDVGRTMAAVDGVASVHDLHIWSLGAGRIALSAHVVLTASAEWPQVLKRLQATLASSFDIEHATLQPELPRAEPIVFRRTLGGG
ncbi:cation diffusion facilitator family transporter [Denitromonas iodatirespirans]|uniref:Cation transporter n=1 Tax=Denitromonas iodatirespirans TaxID=2795389 RepID=A0A944DBV4_DENI1|nr:cation diffusion facilitator family transporter [Denitromonas iodatirespirans]MBT0963629.1 cation transporter [Denitromonas iodatirespirans]